MKSRYTEFDVTMRMKVEMPMTAEMALTMFSFVEQMNKENDEIKDRYRIVDIKPVDESKI